MRLYLTEHAPSLKSFDTIERDLALTLDWYAGRYVNELPEVVTKYTAEHPALAPATVKLRMSYLRAACRWAWKRKKLGDHDPGERVALPSPNNARHEYYDRRQALQIARQIPNLWARAVVLVAFYSGMRLGEVLRAEPTERGWLLRDTKNGRPRIVPIHPKTAYLARQWPPQIAARTVQAHFKAAVRALGWGQLRFHDTRHSTASELINAGIDLYTVGGVLGHKASASTQRYAHLATGTLEAAVGAIGKRR